MPGFLDPKSPTVEAEYARFIDGDVLGKLIFKNFVARRIGLRARDIYIPLGRYGDEQCAADAKVRVARRWRTVEIKCANCNMVNRTHANPDGRKNWAFGRLLDTPGGSSKSFDLAFCVGIETLGLENPHYWSDLKKLEAEAIRRGRDFVVSALPHEPAFLDRCCFFIIPYQSIQGTFFRVNVPAVTTNKYRDYHAWGYDVPRCRLIWQQALRGAR